MLKAAANLTRDLNAPKSAIYWADMLGSALLGYAALFAAMFVRPTWLAVGCGARRRARALSRRLVHPRADAHQEGRGEGLPLRLEPDRRRAAAGAELHVRGRPQPAPRQALLRDGRRPRISAAGADAPVDAAAVPDRRRAGADRHADPLRDPRAAVAAVRRSCGRSSSAAIRACRSIRSSSGRSPKASSRATGRGRRRRAASGRSRCWRWSRPASFRCAIS